MFAHQLPREQTPFVRGHTFDLQISNSQVEWEKKLNIALKNGQGLDPRR